MEGALASVVEIRRGELKRALRQYKKGDRGNAWRTIWKIIEPRFEREVRRYTKILKRQFHEELRHVGMIGLVQACMAVDLSYPDSGQYLCWYARTVMSRFTIAANRKQAYLEDLISEEALEETSPHNPLDEVVGMESEGILQRFIDRLPKDLRAVARLRFMPDVTPDVYDIARILGMRIAHVERTIVEAREALKQLATKEGLL